MPHIFAMHSEFCYHSEIFAMIAKFTVHSEIAAPYPNDPVLCNSHFALNVIILFWLFWYFPHLVRLYKPLYGHFVTLTFHLRSFSFSSCFGSSFLSSLSSFSHFLGCQTHPFEDDNSKDVWLSLKTLKMRVARLVNGGLQVFLCFKWSKYCIYVFQTFQTRV